MQGIPAFPVSLSLEGVSQINSILPERLLALVRPASSCKTLRAGVWLQNSDPKICAAIWLPLFFGDPFFWDPLFSFFFCFFLALQRLARLKCNLEPNCKHILGSLFCSHTPARCVLDFESFAGRGQMLDGRVLGASQVE